MCSNFTGLQNKTIRRLKNITVDSYIPVRSSLKMTTDSWITVKAAVIFA